MNQHFIDIIATKIMGWHSDDTGERWLNDYGDTEATREFWDPTSNIEDAWEVVQEITNTHDRFVDGFPWSTRFATAFDGNHMWVHDARDAADRICGLAIKAAGITAEELLAQGEE